MAVPEAWLRGPVEGVPDLLQPAAHALVQVMDDIPPIVNAATLDQLWARPGGSASIGYHACHLAGALDRLFTYARGEMLSPAQKTAFADEQRVDATRPPAAVLLTQLTQAVDAALAQLRATDPARVLDAREVGRAKLPSSVLGLIFHAAEHSTRHAGQAVTLSKVLGVTVP
jgi:uncharacterized damage-inducible protein DinB